jgi:hypothetical protein
MNGYRWFNNAYDRNVIHRPASNDENFSKNLATSLIKLTARALPYVGEAVVGTAKLTGAAALGTAKYAVRHPIQTGAALYVAGKYADKSNPQRVFNPFAAPYAGVDPGNSKPISTAWLGHNSGKPAYNSDDVTLPELGHDPETVVKSRQVSSDQVLNLVIRSLLHTI